MTDSLLDLLVLHWEKGPRVIDVEGPIVDELFGVVPPRKIRLTDEPCPCERCAHQWTDSARRRQELLGD